MDVQVNTGMYFQKKTIKN